MEYNELLLKNNYIKLTRDEQSELYYQYKEGDESAREQLILSCLALTYRLANRFYSKNRWIDRDDLIQIANIALIKAVEKWNPQRGSLSNVVTTYVNNSFIDASKESKYKIRTYLDITKSACEDMAKIAKVGSDEVDDIVKETKIKHKRVKQLLKIMNTDRTGWHQIQFSKILEDSNDDTNIKGCLADLYKLVDKHLVGIDNVIFKLWMENIKKNNKTRIISKQLDMDHNDILDSIKSSKKILKKVANA